MKKIGLLAVMCSALALPALATNGMRMIGFGPIQDSMGGVGVGVNLDGCTLLSNPAGIAQLGQRLDIAGEFFKPTVKYNATGIVPGQIVANDGRTINSNRGGSPVPAFAYVQPLSAKLSAGIGLFGVAGMGVDYPTNLYNGPTFTSYLQGRFTPGLAYQVSELLSVGVTANLMVAQMKYDVASGVGQALHDTATSLGVGATFGAKFTPSNLISFGAAYETKSRFQDFSFTVPSRPNPFGPPGSTIPGGVDKLTFHQPQSITFGVGVTPIDVLLLAADVQWINWSSTMGNALPRYSTDPNATGVMPFDMGWSDQWVFKVGTQVSLLPGLKLRSGYNYGKMPLDPGCAFENLAFPAVSEHHVTFGAGYEVNQHLTANLAGVYAFNARLQGSNAGPPPPMGGTGQGIASYSTEMSQLELGLGLAYRF